MIAMDQYLIDFISNNWLTCAAAITFLKGMAKITPGTTDDKIVTLIGNVIGGLRPGRTK